MLSNDDLFTNQSKTPFEIRRSAIRHAYEAKYCDLNIHFAYILFCLTMRTGIYIGLRLTSCEKIMDWTFIKPVVFYLTYATDLLIVGGVMYFIVKTTPLKEKYAKTMTIDSPEPETNSPVNQINDDDENGSIDGDAQLLIRSRSNSSDS